MENTFTEVEEIKSTSIAIVTEENFALIFNGKVDAKIAEVEKQLKKILQKPFDDKQAYQEMKDLKNKVIVKMRTGTVAKSKEMTEDYKKNIAKIKEVENSIIDRVTKKLEAKADERIEAYENHIKELELKAEREAKEKLDNRIKTLIENGIVFTGSWYAINEISVGTQMIQEISDADFEDLLAKVQHQNNHNIAQQKIKDDAEKLEREKQETLRKENEAKEKALQEQQDAINKQLKDLEDAKNELARKEKEQKELEEKQKEYEQEVAIGQKMSRYEDLGMKYIYVRKQLEWVNSVGQITITKDTFINESPELYENTVTAINKFSKEEDDAIALSEKIKEENEVREAMASLARKEKEEKEAEEKRNALLDDTQKYGEWIEKLRAITPPTTITNEALLSKVNAIVNLINQ